jgi:hypothetical protein
VPYQEHHANLQSLDFAQGFVVVVSGAVGETANVSQTKRKGLLYSLLLLIDLVLARFFLNCPLPYLIGAYANQT